jgi:hypothetical protein
MENRDTISPLRPIDTTINPSVKDYQIAAYGPVLLADENNKLRAINER